MQIAFLLPQIGINGGIYVVLEYATRINVKPNVEVFIITEKPTLIEDYSWHTSAHELKFITLQEVNCFKFDITFATSWSTVFFLPSVKSLVYAYFVQSIESRFFLNKDQLFPLMADFTYACNIPTITEATWIKEYLYDKYGSSSYLVKNGIRKDLYRTDGALIKPRDRHILRVLVEGPLGVSFKNVEKTLTLCKKSLADEVWLLTSSKTSDLSLADRVFSHITIEQVPLVYRSCDVIVKLSYVEGMFGPPLELFHCGGTAIVYDVTGHDEYIINNHNGIVIAPDDEIGVINAINELKRNPDKLAQLKLHALETANAWHDWASASEDFFNASEELISNASNNNKNNKHLLELIDNFKRVVELRDDHTILNQIINSTSWRLTKPLRYFNQLLKNLKWKLNTKFR